MIGCSLRGRGNRPGAFPSAASGAAGQRRCATWVPPSIRWWRGGPFRSAASGDAAGVSIRITLPVGLPAPPAARHQVSRLESVLVRRLAASGIRYSSGRVPGCVWRCAPPSAASGNTRGRIAAPRRRLGWPLAREAVRAPCEVRGAGRDRTSGAPARGTQPFSARASAWRRGLTTGCSRRGR